MKARVITCLLALMLSCALSVTIAEEAGDWYYCPPDKNWCAVNKTVFLRMVQLIEKFIDKECI